MDIYDTIEAMYIILELMEGGELFDRIKIKGKLSEPCAKIIFYQVILAVRYLHKEGITHRDLKVQFRILSEHSTWICQYYLMNNKFFIAREYTTKGPFG